jgi:hypothetical protein
MRIPRDIVMVAVTLIPNTIIGRIIFVVIITHLLIAGMSAIISRFGTIGSFVGLIVVWAAKGSVLPAANPLSKRERTRSFLFALRFIGLSLSVRRQYR